MVLDVVDRRAGTILVSRLAIIMLLELKYAFNYGIQLK